MNVTYLLSDKHTLGLGVKTTLGTHGKQGKTKTIAAFPQRKMKEFTLFSNMY